MLNYSSLILFVLEIEMYLIIIIIIALAYMVQILFSVFGMGHIYENAQIIHNHGTLLHTTVP